MKPLKHKETFNEINEYIPSDSEDDYTEAEKDILANTRKGISSDEEDSEEEVYGVLSDNDDSDLDLPNEEDDLPNVRAWGKSKRSFFNTDYVDQDYGGFQGQDGEDADVEEQEAREIQQRLTKQLDDQDFCLDLFFDSNEPRQSEKIEPATKDVIKTDWKTLSKRQQRALFEKESPEFQGLVKEFTVGMTVIQEKLEPMLKLIKEKNIHSCPAVTFIKTKYELTLNYCINISFYLLLKAKRLNVQTHPIVKRLLQYRQLVQQLEPSWIDVVKPQVDQLLEMHANNKEVYSTPDDMLDILKPTVFSASVKKTTKKKVVFAVEEEIQDDEKEEEMEEEKVPKMPEELGKRGITRQIEKNKGLTPHRKKEQRNPRVKNRNKFRKAVIKRKGQVRTVRKEVTRYAGEIYGIKAGIKKGIKIKV